ncbi:hypothetical protein ACFLZQ_01605 [Thermodesulfobacteriota bacterium]
MNTEKEGAPEGTTRLGAPKRSHTHNTHILSENQVNTNAFGFPAQGGDQFNPVREAAHKLSVAGVSPIAVNQDKTSGGISGKNTRDRLQPARRLIKNFPNQMHA